MRKVVFPTVKELLGLKKATHEFLDFKYGRSIFNPFNYFLVTILFFTLAPGTQRFHSVISLALFIFFIFIFAQTAKKVTSLSIQRKVKGIAKEWDNYQVQYTISNSGAYPFSRIEFIDGFDGTENQEIAVSIAKPIKGFSVKRHTEIISLDAGMGTKKFSTLSSSISDHLNLFPFLISFDLGEEIEVYPKIEPLLPIIVKENTNTFSFGEVDIVKRGQSINFLGLRPYRPGDPVRRINWRQTVKMREPIINIFEHNVNKSLNILLNTGEDLHSGNGQKSSMEYIKDLVLSLVSQNISNGNEIRLVTNRQEYPAGSGQNYMCYLEKTLFALNPEKDLHAASFVKRVLLTSSWATGSDSSVIYVTPIVPGPLFEKNLEALLLLKARGLEVQIISIDALNYWASKIRFGAEHSLQPRVANKEVVKKKWTSILRKAGIPFYDIVIQRENSFTKSANLSIRENKGNHAS